MGETPLEQRDSLHFATARAPSDPAAVRSGRSCRAGRRRRPNSWFVSGGRATATNCLKLWTVSGVPPKVSKWNSANVLSVDRQRPGCHSKIWHRAGDHGHVRQRLVLAEGIPDVYCDQYSYLDPRSLIAFSWRKSPVPSGMVLRLLPSASTTGNRSEARLVEKLECHNSPA